MIFSTSIYLHGDNDLFSIIDNDFRERYFWFIDNDLFIVDNDF